MALGDVESGTARLHHAIEIARANGDMDGLAYAYANLADLLFLRGHSRRHWRSHSRRSTLSRAASAAAATGWSCRSPSSSSPPATSRRPTPTS